MEKSLINEYLAHQITCALFDNDYITDLEDVAFEDVELLIQDTLDEYNTE